MPPTLHTQRLRLRPPRSTDLENIYRLGSSSRVMRYITPGRTQSRQEAKTDLKKRLATVNDPLGYWIAEEKHSKAFIGWMALKQLTDTPDIEIGYRFLEEFWGRGYATEGGFKILNYAFRTLELERVVAVAVEENRASIRVMEKLGMQFVRYDQFYNTECVYYELKRSVFLRRQQGNQARQLGE
jgi:ribosomal-protein-alanine N-acetyltransferase